MLEEKMLQWLFDVSWVSVTMCRVVGEKLQANWIIHVLWSLEIMMMQFMKENCYRPGSGMERIDAVRAWLKKMDFEWDQSMFPSQDLRHEKFMRPNKRC